MKWKSSHNRLLSLLLSFAMVISLSSGLAITADAEENITVSVNNAASGYSPTQIVNGDFAEMPFMAYTYNGTTYTTYSGNNKGNNQYVTSIPNGVDGGWNTTETKLHVYGLIEAWYLNCSNQPTALTSAEIRNDRFIEMNAHNSAILYQDLNTTGGDVIRWTLKHGARAYVGISPQSIQVQIGASDGSYPSGINSNKNAHIKSDTLATYTSQGIISSGGYGYGNLSELAALSIAPSGRSGFAYFDSSTWHTAAGVYIVPAGQTVTRFAFESLNNGSDGNFLDDITFSTLIGNLNADFDADENLDITGYWGESDSSKKLCVQVGDTVYKIDMSSVLNKNFIVNVPEALISSNDVSSIKIYHQDYETSQKTIKLYTVTLDANGGTISDPDWAENTETKDKTDDYIHKASSFTLPIPTREGFVFTGWSDIPEEDIVVDPNEEVDEEETEEVDEAEENFAFEPTEDTTLYAHWERDISKGFSTITYTANLREISGTVTLNGYEKVGQILTATYNYPDNCTDEDYTVKYAWYRVQNDTDDLIDDGENKNLIVTTEENNYLLQKEDRDNKIIVKVLVNNGKDPWVDSSTPITAVTNSIIGVFTTNYVMTFPANTTVENAGFTELTNGLTIQNTTTDEFDVHKKVTVTATSANNWTLKAPEVSTKIDYEMYSDESTKAPYVDSEKAYTFDFAAAEIDSAKNMAIGIKSNKKDMDKAKAGTYIDTVTFTASLEDVE